MTDQKQTPKDEKDVNSSHIQRHPKSVNNPEDMEKEIGGYEHKAEPTRYGDWETNGRCTDF